MTQPQYYLDPATGQYVLGGAPQPPAPPAPPQPVYVPQYAQAPAAYPQQQWSAQPQYGMPQQYPGMPPAGPPAPPLAQGTLADFYGQPSSGGGKALSWKDKPIGTTYVILVTREITSADIQQQTEINSNRPAFFRDGRPKFVMKVPARMAPSPEYPDGTCQWFVQGASRDELTRAMQEAGVPLGEDGNPRTPEAGSVIEIKLTGKRPVANMSPANVMAVRYWRPSDPFAGQFAAALGTPQQVAQPAVQQFQPAQPYPVAQPAPAQFPPAAFVPPSPQPVIPPPPPVPAPPQPQTVAVQPQPTAAPVAQQPPAAGPVPQPPAQQQWPAAPGVPQLSDDQRAQLQAMLAGQMTAAQTAG